MFGLSVFQSVLQRLDKEAAQVEDTDQGFAGMPGLGTGFVADTTPFAGMSDSATVRRAYLDTAEGQALEPPLREPVPVMPPYLARTSPSDVAENLDINDRDTPESLAEKRRRFAASNHPDRHHPDFRTNATIRMKIANMLIDEALRRLATR